MLDVNVQLERGESLLEFRFQTDSVITGVFGKSGAGKSTLLNLIAGIVKPTAGEVMLGDDVLTNSKQRMTVATHRRRLGVVFQDDRLFPHLTVKGNLNYGRDRGSNKSDQTTHIGFDDTVELLNLNSLLRRRIRNLSGGERQRVAIGRALLSSPRLLLFDEPLSSLDREHKQQILGLIERIRDELGVPMLYVSHDLTELLQLTGRLLIVDSGRSIAHGELREVVKQTRAWRAIRDLGPMNVMELVVHDHDAEAALTSFEAAGDTKLTRRLLGPIADRRPGAVVHVSIRAEDIALALHPIEDTSIRNQLPGRIVGVTLHPDRALVQVDAGAQLLVELSHKTIRRMNIAPGLEVICLIKSNAVQYVD